MPPKLKLLECIDINLRDWLNLVGIAKAKAPFKTKYSEVINTFPQLVVL